MLRNTFFLLIVLSLCLLAFGYSRGNENVNSQGEIVINNGYSENKFIEGIVIDKSSKGISLALIDESKIVTGTIRVGFTDEKMLANINEGQEVKVWFDFIRESKPPQTRGLKIKPINNKK